MFEQVFDAFDIVGVEAAVHIAHQRQARRGDVQTVEHLAQRLTGRRHDAGVEGVTDRQPHRLIAQGLEDVDRFFHCLAFAADDRLVVAVDVGGDDVATDLGQCLLNELIGRHDGSHPAVVAHADFGHFGAACGGRFQGVGKRHDAGGDQGGVFAQRVPHHHVGVLAVGCQ